MGYHPTTGHLATVTGPQSINLTLGYNGRLLTDQTWSDMTTSTTVHHDHDDFFRVKYETVNGLFPAVFHYDDDGLLDEAGGMTLKRNMATGLLDETELVVDTGVVLDQYERNTHGEVERYTVRFNNNVGFEVLTLRDGMGRIDSRTEITNLPMNMQTTFVDYVYDAAGRLTDANGSQGSTHYDFDANGNRLGRTDGNGTESGVYDDQDRIRTYAGRTYGYNLRGSLESVTNGNATTNYSYDALGGLRQVVLPNGTNIEYEVDGAGRRVWKSRNGQREQGFVYADGLRPVAELNGVGQVVARFIYGRHINVPDIMIKNGTAYRIITDHLGSPRFVVNVQTGMVEQTITYDEFGRVVSDSAPGSQPFGFAGGLYDVDTKLVRFGARDYDAYTGRWTAKDPIGFGGGVNLYLYANSEPINQKDPTGLTVLICGGKPENEMLATFGFEHVWLKTSSKEAGLIGDGFTDIEIGDHQYVAMFVYTSHHCEAPRFSVDEACVDNLLDIGKKLGVWIPLVNDCNSFVHRVLAQCGTGCDTTIQCCE